MKKKIEEDMNSFLPANQNSVVENIRKKVDGSKFRDSNQEIIVSNLFNEEKRDKLLDVSLLKGICLSHVIQTHPVHRDAYRLSIQEGA